MNNINYVTNKKLYSYIHICAHMPINLVHDKLLKICLQYTTILRMDQQLI